MATPAANAVPSNRPVRSFILQSLVATLNKGPCEDNVSLTLTEYVGWVKS